MEERKRKRRSEDPRQRAARLERGARAHPTRTAILELLARDGGRALTRQGIASEVELPADFWAGADRYLDYHLKVLGMAGLAVCEDGLYRATAKPRG